MAVAGAGIEGPNTGIAGPVAGSGGGGGGGGGGKTLITTPQTYYVTLAGSDVTGNGTQVAPWATPQHAIEWIAQNIAASPLLLPDSGNNAITVQIGVPGVAGQVFNLTSPIFCLPIQDISGRTYTAFSVDLVGDNTTPSNITLSYTDANTNWGVVTSSCQYTTYSVAGFTLNSDFAGLVALNAGQLSVGGNIIFTGSGTALVTYNGGQIGGGGWNVTINSASLNGVFNIGWFSFVSFQSMTVTFAQNPTAIGIVAAIYDSGSLAFERSTFANPTFVTGQKFNISDGSQIDPYGSNSTTIATWPGTVAPFCDASSSFNGSTLATQKAGLPTTNDLIAGAWGVFYNTSSGTVSLAYNNAGTIKYISGGGGVANNKYVAVAASQSNTLLGSTGAIGDYFNDILIIPATTSPGAVTIKDSSGGSQITIFAGGSASINDLTPFTLSLGFPSAAGGWYVTTGANVSVIAAGTFS